MDTILLEKIAEFLEKQDLLSRLTESEVLHGYGYSEIHVIDAIGRLKEPNVSAIAAHLHMTKGAISKITKKLMVANVIKSYTIPENKQKIFFQLTKSGQILYKEHETRHQLWLKRDKQFLSQYSHSQLEQIASFLDSFNGYLAQQIKELGEK